MQDIEPIQVGQISNRYLVDASSEAKPGLREFGAPLGTRERPPHSHEHNDEYIVVLEGEGTGFLTYALPLRVS